MTDTVTSELKSFAKGVWWLVLLRGILAIVFGILALLAPIAALTGIAIVYGAYTLVDGIFTIVHAVRERSRLTSWGWLLFQGIVAVIAGVLLLIFPLLGGLFATLFLVWLVVIWNVIHGVAGIRSAAGARDGSRAKTWGIVAGVASILLGILLGIIVLVDPGATLIGVVWAVGIWAILFGIMLIVMAIQVRSAWHKAHAAANPV
jgi:uncharacterized membrane protein HdeD (DUF308 family)